jgi:hypothetical protein
LGRFANCLGRVPERLLKDTSTSCRFPSFAIATGIVPDKLF